MEIREQSTHRLLKTLRGAFNVPSCLAFSPDGKLLAVGDTGGCVALLDLDGGTPRSVRTQLMGGRATDYAGQYGHYGGVNSLAFDRGGKRLVSLGGDNHVKIWDTATGDLVNHMQNGFPSGWGDRRSVVAWVAGRTRLVTASRTGDLRLWAADTAELLNSGTFSRGPLIEPNYWIGDLAISPDGKMLAGAIVTGGPSPPSENYRIILWDIGELQVVPRQQRLAPGTPPKPIQPLP